MALTEDSITRLSQQMSASENNLTKFYERVEHCEGELKGNANYQIFANNTEIGRDLNAKLEKLLVLGRGTGNDVKTLLERTEDFVERQKVLNNRYNNSNTGGQGVGAPVQGPTTPSTIPTLGSGYTYIPGGNRVPTSAVGGGN